MPDEGDVRYGVSNAVVCVDGKYVPVGEISELELVGCGYGLTEPIEVSFEEYEWLQKLLEEK